MKRVRRKGGKRSEVLYDILPAGPSVRSYGFTAAQAAEKVAHAAFWSQPDKRDMQDRLNRVMRYYQAHRIIVDDDGDASTGAWLPKLIYVHCPITPGFEGEEIRT